MNFLKSISIHVIQWFDSDFGNTDVATIKAKPDKVEWSRILPFIILHLGCLAVFFVGWSWIAVGVAIGLYLLRMFAITGFYHRYFSHKSFSTSRVAQFIFAVIGGAAVQRGPICQPGDSQ